MKLLALLSWTFGIAVVIFIYRSTMRSYRATKRLRPRKNSQPNDQDLRRVKRYIAAAKNTDRPQKSSQEISEQLDRERLRRAQSISDANGIQLLAENGDMAEAISRIKETPLVFCDLSEELRGNELLAAPAVIKAPINSKHLSNELRSSVSFFIKVFNEKTTHRLPISMSSARDMLFYMEHAKSWLNYHHTVSEQKIRSCFSLTEKEFSTEIESARRLISLIRDYTWLKTYDKALEISTLRKLEPGFSDASYEHVYDRGYSNRSADLGSWRW